MIKGVIVIDIYSYEGEEVYFKASCATELVPKSEEANKYLKDRDVYIVDFVWVGHSFSRVYLKEFPDLAFNTVYFENKNKEGKRDGLFVEEYKESEDFKRYIHIICPTNSRMRLGLGSGALTKEQVFLYFKTISYDKNNVKYMDMKSDESKQLLKRFRHQQMHQIKRIAAYHDLISVYFWNGPNQFIEFYLNKE